MDTIVAVLDFDHPVWQGFLLALLFGAAILAAWSPLQKIRAHLQLQRLISALGHDSLKGVALADGADVPVFLDYLLLRPDGLLVLIVKPFRGNIFAANKIEKWTQVIRHHSFKFTNPLYELDTTTQALRGMWPKIVIQGLVVFAQGAHFPKGKPESVCSFEDLKAMASREDKREIPESLRQLWQEVRNSMQPLKSMNPSILYQRGDKRRLGLAAILLITALVFLCRYMGWLTGVF